jgi:hypothetical protein
VRYAIFDDASYSITFYRIPYYISLTQSLMTVHVCLST